MIYFHLNGCIKYGHFDVLSIQKSITARLCIFFLVLSLVSVGNFTLMAHQRHLDQSYFRGSTATCGSPVRDNDASDHREPSWPHPISNSPVS